MIAAVYASLYSLIIVWLSLRVIGRRYKHKVSVGDGGVEELKIARGAQSNAVEYLPIGLLLMLVLEFNGAALWVVHVFGMALIIGRVFHIKGMFAKRLTYRVVGMHITIYALIGLSIVNMAYLPFEKFIWG
ncbi:MAPEG family protein [Kaarinaea lacus]